MDWPLPVPWTNAVLAGYFGGRACPLCDHRNPVDAKFCNDCGSPLKPCNQCDAVNLQAATKCHKCGVEYPAIFTTVFSAADPAPALTPPDDVGVAATVTQPLSAAGALRAGWGLAVIVTILIWGLGATATILIAGAYTAYRNNAAMPDVAKIASQPIATAVHSPPTAGSVVAMAEESKPLEPETTAALPAPIPTSDPEAPKRASVHQRPVPVPATKHVSTRQRPVPAPATKHASVRQRPVPEAPTPVAQTLAAAPVDAPAAETREARRPDPWEAMHASLASCGGDLIARIVCDQRVRRRFCEGRWGEAPECASRVAYDHRQ